MTNDQVLEYVTKSFDLKRQGYYKPAIEMLYKALSIESENVEILSQLAALYFLLENNQRAINYIEKTLEVDPFHIECLKLLKDIYLKDENYVEAQKAAVKIYNINSTTENLAEEIRILNKMNDFATVQEIELKNIEFDDKVLYEIAVAYFQNKKFEKAISLLESAMYKNFDNLDVASLLAEAYFINNQLDEAKALFDKLENEVSDPKILNYLGLYMLDDMKLEAAIKYFTSASKMDERNSKYVYNLANAYFLSGWKNEAIKFFNIAICLSPENQDYHYALAYLHFQYEEFEKAQNEIMGVLEVEESHVQAQVLNALIKSKKGDPVAAKLDLDKIVKNNPKDDFVIFSLAKICVELSQLKEANRLMEKVIELKPKSLNYLSEYAEILINMSHHGEAQEIIEKILEQSPNYIAGYILQAKNYIEIKDLDGAFEAAQKAIDLDENTPDGYYYNSLVLFEQGDINFAIENLKKAISLDVNNALYYATMSEFYQALGQYENALAYIGEAGSIDESAKNKELYAKLAAMVRKSKL